MEIARRQLGENTRAVHLPPPPDTPQRPLGTPIYRTAAFAFSSAQEYAAVLGDQVPGYSYSRIDNPTVDAFARAVAALEGANLPRWPGAQAFASGMAAISGVFMAFARAGAHVVAPTALYGGTYSLLRNVLTRFGVETDFVDITNLDAVRAAMRPATRIVYAETIANPTTAVADIRHLAEIAHERGALLVIDSTLAPPGKHVLFTWGQYHSYELSNGENWDDIAEREADKLYDLVCQYAPNMRGKMIARHIQTPLEIERTLGLLRANVMHLEMSLDQMFMYRPLPELSAYKVPGLPGLYLTGASTHPGGGVFAASGYNTAQVILREKK